MVRTWRHVAALTLVHAACASPPGGSSDAGASGEGWACRKLHGGPARELGRTAGRSLTPRMQGGSDAGTVAGSPVPWPVLAGACLASRV